MSLWGPPQRETETHSRVRETVLRLEKMEETRLLISPHSASASGETSLAMLTLFFNPCQM